MPVLDSSVRELEDRLSQASSQLRQIKKQPFRVNKSWKSPNATIIKKSTSKNTLSDSSFLSDSSIDNRKPCRCGGVSIKEEHNPHDDTVVSPVQAAKKGMRNSWMKLKKLEDEAQYYKSMFQEKRETPRRTKQRNNRYTTPQVSYTRSRRPKRTPQDNHHHKQVLFEEEEEFLFDNDNNDNRLNRDPNESLLLFQQSLKLLQWSISQTMSQLDNLVQDNDGINNNDLLNYKQQLKEVFQTANIYTTEHSSSTPVFQNPPSTIKKTEFVKPTPRKPQSQRMNNNSNKSSNQSQVLGGNDLYDAVLSNERHKYSNDGKNDEDLNMSGVLNFTKDNNMNVTMINMNNRCSASSNNNGNNHNHSTSTLPAKARRSPRVFLSQTSPLDGLGLSQSELSHFVTPTSSTYQSMLTDLSEINDNDDDNNGNRNDDDNDNSLSLIIPSSNKWNPVAVE